MAEYKRMVSYMYQYENGVKKKNVGYARIEAKNGECRITLHMQLPGLLDSIFPIYMIQRKKGDMELIYIGEAALKNQTMDSRLSAKEANIMDSGYSLSDMGGMLLFLNESVFYATEWDDKAVIREEVMAALRPKNKESGKNNAPPLKEWTEADHKEEKNTLEALQEASEEEALEEDASVPFYQLPRGWKTIELKNPREERMPVNPWETVERWRSRMGQPEEEPTGKQGEEQSPDKNSSGWQEEQPASDQNNQSPDHEIGPVGDTDGGQEAEPKTTPQTEPATDSFGRPQAGAYARSAPEQRQEAAGNTEKGRDQEAGEQEKEEERAESPLACKLFESYPRIYPFEDNEITMCIKIEPKDIGYLPAEAWVLSNNSFLLHGYYCYNHLILAKIKEGKGYRYLLGVPGIYHNRERFMARMFGFDCFKSIRKRDLRQGDFGYWYVPVSL